MKTRSGLSLRALCEGAVFVALAQIVGYIKLFSLPNGGSITVAMLPIFIFCARWGLGPGFLASLSLGVLQLLLDGAYAWGWESMLGDYLLGYAVLGAAAFFTGKKKGFFLGIGAGSLARFLVAWFVGAIVWGEYMPDSFFGMTMTSPWFYSAIYNGSYIFLSMILCLAVGILLWKPLGKYIRGEDLK